MNPQNYSPSPIPTSMLTFLLWKSPFGLIFSKINSHKHPDLSGKSRPHLNLQLTLSITDFGCDVWQNEPYRAPSRKSLHLCFPYNPPPILPLFYFEFDTCFSLKCLQLKILNIPGLRLGLVQPWKRFCAIRLVSIRDFNELILTLALLQVARYSGVFYSSLWPKKIYYLWKPSSNCNEKKTQPKCAVESKNCWTSMDSTLICQARRWV